MEFNTSRNNLVGSNKKYHQNFLEFKKEFPTQDDLVVVVESEDTEKNRQFVERWAREPKLQGDRVKGPMETNLFRDVFYKGDLKMLGRKALLFVPETDLVELQKTLKDYRPFIEQFTPDHESRFAVRHDQHAVPDGETRNRTPRTNRWSRRLPALERSSARPTPRLTTGTPPSPGITALFNPGADAEQEIYITFAKGRIYLVNCPARRRTMINGEAVTACAAGRRKQSRKCPG